MAGRYQGCFQAVSAELTELEKVPGGEKQDPDVGLEQPGGAESFWV